VVSEILDPTTLVVKEVLEKKGRYKLFYQALMATGLYKELELIEDKSFVPLDGFVDVAMTGDWVPSWSKTPRRKMYGYTILAESDSVYKTYSINDLDELKAYAKNVYDQVYPQDAGIDDVTNRKNSLNRFVAYHLLDRQVGYEKFIYNLDNTGVIMPNKSHSTKVVDMFDYIETMCPNTLLEVRTFRKTNDIYGVFNMTDTIGAQCVRINTEFKDMDALNGVVHELDKILTYSKDFLAVLTSKRIRLDAATFFSELTNNNMRCSGLAVHWRLPNGYLKNLKTTQGTQINYLTPFDRFCNFQGDEIFSSVPGGVFEATFITPPIPSGTYEVRFGYLNNGKRGIVQMYFDGEPCGIPVDLNLNLDEKDPYKLVGWVNPGSDPLDPNGTENDKSMHNRGYMKGPASYKIIIPGWQRDAVGRKNPNCLRRVLGVYKFTEDGPHQFKCKAAESNGEFMFDFLEFVPLEAIEQEDVY
jgi:hypothetical protein